MYNLHQVRADYVDHLSLMMTLRKPVKLSEFRELTSNTTKRDDCDYYSVLFFAQDGNDYAIIFNGLAYVLIVLDNDAHADSGEVLTMHSFETYKEALNELLMISLTDTED